MHVCVCVCARWLFVFCHALSLSPQQLRLYMQRSTYTRVIAAILVTHSHYMRRSGRAHRLVPLWRPHHVHGCFHGRVRVYCKREIYVTLINVNARSYARARARANMHARATHIARRPTSLSACSHPSSPSFPRPPPLPGAGAPS
jgi:hypothetical protein